MNIGILGGSFDPPHFGHTIIAKRLLKLLDFDEIWLMPCFTHPFNKNISPSSQRFEMTRFLESKKIKISDFELRKKSISYSIDTLESLKAGFPKHRFSWIIGTDQVKDFRKWKKWQEIINKFRVIVVPRTGFEKARLELNKILKEVSFPNHITPVDKDKFKPVYISSTLIRKRVKEKKPIKNLVPKKVEKYIIEHELYS